MQRNGAEALADLAIALARQHFTALAQLAVATDATAGALEEQAQPHAPPDRRSFRIRRYPEKS
ncbi:hypothetical protein V3C33_03880 [Micrococcaceae bacterium Sec5.7]